MRSDVCFVLGVIEYIWWPDQIFVELAKWTESVVFSYNVVDLLALNRSEFWVNTLSVSDLHRFAETAGFAVSDERPFSDGKQVLVRADQKFGNRRRCLRSLVRMTYRRR
jgi:hypothetical protein